MSSNTIEISELERQLRSNAIAYLQKRHVGAMTFDGHTILRDSDGGPAKSFWSIIVQDWRAGAKYRAIAMRDIDQSVNPELLSGGLTVHFADLDKNIDFEVGDSTGKRPSIASTDMPLVGRVVIYTNTFGADRTFWNHTFRAAGHVLDIVEEDELFKSLFISYGGPDAKAVAKINRELKVRGVRTWFFPVDAISGQKLHRVMSTGVMEHDRVLLVCSKTSLSRPGVLNELERVLEREAAEGGTEILIPVSLDDFVYSDWAPSRKDLAAQIRARVIGKFPKTAKGTAFQIEIDKLLAALKLTK